MPTIMRGRTDTRGLVKNKSIGPCGRVAALTSEVTPKIPPTTAPAAGPSSTPAMMAGTCIKVIETPANQGMKPMLKSTRTIETAPRAPEITIFLTDEEVAIETS
jgi:hypothetical protein